MSLPDIRVPAVLPRIDRDPLHHGTPGAVRPARDRPGDLPHRAGDRPGLPAGRTAGIRDEEKASSR